MGRILPFRRRSAPAEVPRPPASAPAAYPERDELLELLCRLSPGARAALLLEHAGWTDAEIARLINATAGAVEALLRDGRAQMSRDWRGGALGAVGGA